ncbi:TetR/AcrR family transcriptional regulator [Tissierella praeacuta]|uniref:TetR/AcrR family transcriptional regulator n=1 Tax=Tissierella praeacuta TaxID=43131 RepID=UPI00333E69E9
MEENIDKKKLILKNSAEIFAHKGYFGTGINEILNSCDIPKGSFYYYFPGGKEELAIQVLHYVYDKMVDGINKNIFSTSDNAVIVFSRMLDRLSTIFDRKNVFESLVITFMGLESIYISDRLSDESKKIYEKWQEFYRDKLLDCGYSQDDAKDYSLILFTLIHGSLISCWIKQDTADLQRMKEQLPKLLPKI